MELNPIFVNLIAWIAMAAGMLLAVWWLIGLLWVRDRGADEEIREAGLPGNLHEASGGIPPVLIIFFALIAVSLVFYVLFVWLGGITY